MVTILDLEGKKEYKENNVRKTRRHIIQQHFVASSLKLFTCCKGRKDHWSLVWTGNGFMKEVTQTDGCGKNQYLGNQLKQPDNMMCYHLWRQTSVVKRNKTLP